MGMLFHETSRELGSMLSLPTTPRLLFEKKRFNKSKGKLRATMGKKLSKPKLIIKPKSNKKQAKKAKEIGYYCLNEQCSKPAKQKTHKKSMLCYLKNKIVISTLCYLLNFQDYLSFLRTSNQIYSKKKINKKISLMLIKRMAPITNRLSYWTTQCNLSINKDKYMYYVLKNCKADEDISRDLDRTFPKEHKFYKKTENRQRLNKVLKAFANKNPDIGYIQGLNFIAGHLLLQFNDEVIKF